MPFLENLRGLFKNDPKPIFDHFRNIAIVGGLYVGAGALQNFHAADNLTSLNNLTVVVSITIEIIASILLVMNVSFASSSINKFLFDKEELSDNSEKAISSTVLWIYSGFLFFISIMYTFNSPQSSIWELSENSRIYEARNVRDDKLVETVSQMVEQQKAIHLNLQEIEEEVQTLKNLSKLSRSENVKTE